MRNGIAFLLFIFVANYALAYTVGADEVINNENYNVASGGVFINYGEIDVTNFYVCPGCSLDIQNYGQFSADNFIVPMDATVRQVIISNSTANYIDGFDGYDTIVRDGENLSICALADASRGASNVSFENVSLDVDGAFLLDGTTVEFRDMVTLNFSPDATLPDDGIIFKNLVNNGRIVINSINTDSMYTWRIAEDIPNGIIGVRFVRETDYTRFMSPDIGGFLNSLRNDSRNSEFMARLDRATDMHEIEHVLSQSAHTNPINLMTSIAGINDGVMFNMADISNGRDVYFRPLLLMNTDSITYGIRAGGGINIVDKLNVGVHVQSGYMNFVGDVDEYTANIFGGGLNLNWNDEFIIARLMAGMTVANFDIDAVYDSGRVFETPTGIASYVAGDVGAKLSLPYHIFIAPTVGFDGVRNKIANSTESVMRMNIASDIGFDCVTYDIRYHYAGRVRLYSNGDVGYGVRVAINSDADNIGGDASIMRIRRDDVTSTEISAMVRILF